MPSLWTRNERASNAVHNTCFRDYQVRSETAITPYAPTEPDRKNISCPLTEGSTEMTSIVQPGMDWVGSRSRRAAAYCSATGSGQSQRKVTGVALLGERSGAEDEREE